MVKTNVFEGMLDSYVFMSVITVTVLFQIIIAEFLGTFANTYPLSLVQWFFSILFGILSMPLAVVVIPVKE